MLYTAVAAGGRRAFQYIGPVLQRTLQLMGCKARQAFKARSDPRHDDSETSTSAGPALVTPMTYEHSDAAPRPLLRALRHGEGRGGAAVSPDDHQPPSGPKRSSSLHRLELATFLRLQAVHDELNCRLVVIRAADFSEIYYLDAVSHQIQA